MSADQQYFSAEVYYFIVIAKNKMLQLNSRNKIWNLKPVAQFWSIQLKSNLNT